MGKENLDSLENVSELLNLNESLSEHRLGDGLKAGSA